MSTEEKAREYDRIMRETGMADATRLLAMWHGMQKAMRLRRQEPIETNLW